jgi:hypothetical protein
MQAFLKWTLRFLWWLTFVAITIVLLAFVYRNWMIKQVMEKEARTVLGLGDAEAENLSVGVLEPKVTFGNLKLYNTADFGGGLFMDVPELHVEYDRDALKRHEIHLKLVLVVVKELDVVKNSSGATNIASILKTVAPPSPTGGGRKFAPVNGYTFTGIDVLNFSLASARLVDLKDQKRNATVNINLQDIIVKNVKTPADLQSLRDQISSRGGHLVGLPGATTASTAAPTKPKGTIIIEMPPGH